MRRLKTWLDKSPLTQKEFGESLTPTVSQATVSDWVTGKMAPSFERLMHLSSKTGIPLRSLIEDCAENEKARAAERQSAA